MLALPLPRLAVGVKVALYTLASVVAARPPSVPPVVVTSLSVKLLPGSSLKVKVMVGGAPVLATLALLLITNVGTSVSMLMIGVAPAAPAFPAESVYMPLATVMLALPLARLAVGVNVAVRVRPLPLRVPKVPPVVTTSASTKLVVGSALKLKVIVAV